MKIYVPSMSRHEYSKISPGPVAYLPKSADVSYVVPESQADVYRRVMHNDWPWVKILPFADSIHGIAATRHHIGLHAAETNHDRFIMMDDDVRLLVRRAEDTWRLRRAGVRDVVTMLSHVDQWLGTHAHVGISPREGNNRAGPGGPDLVQECTRTLRCLAYRTREFLSVEHERVRVMEDFDVNLQLLERGHPNVSLFYWSQGQIRTNAPGGCSTYRSHLVHEESAHRLVELHPGLVRLRQKENKTDREGFGTRTEVTISWKKAYTQRTRDSVDDERSW